MFDNLSMFIIAVAVVLSVLIYGLVQQEIKEDQAIADLIKLGKNPIEVGCGFGNVNSNVCAAIVGRKD